MTIRKIISGGQTGVDRAALDVALDLKVACGGWCPKGRVSEEGPIPKRYPLKETTSALYHIRTKSNVCDSDATLILNLGSLDGGTALTADLASDNGRPYMIVDLDDSADITSVVAWLKENKISVLNIAGPRASKRDDVYKKAQDFLLELIPVATKRH